MDKKQSKTNSPQGALWLPTNTCLETFLITTWDWSHIVERCYNIEATINLDKDKQHGTKTPKEQI